MKVADKESLGVKILSLFDGMACGMIAMQLARVKVYSYDAYEIDKYAIKTAQHNFPMIKEHGDVFDADFTQYEGVDFLIGGSPCTYWSIAQTKNRETVASGMGWELFSQYVRALHEAKPKYFIYENNKSMSKDIRASIDKAFGFEAVLINSALVSAQNRQRLYWVGKRNEDGTYSKVNVEQPADRGILLKDVYAYKGDGEGSLKSELFPDNPIKQTSNYVAEPVCLRYERSEEAKRCRKAYEAHEIHHGYNELSELHPRPDGKTNTLTTVLKDNQIMESIPTMPVKEATARGYTEIECGECVDLSMPNSKTRRGRNMADKANCMQTSNEFYQYVGYAIEFDDDGRPIKAIGKDGKEITIYEVKDGKITIKGKQYPIKLKDGFYIIRKLTVSECKRLQTVPEWYEFPVSNSQAYKMLGNGWTCEVICHLIQSCISHGVTVQEWVSVDDRLPDACGFPCLLCGKNSFGQIRVFEGFTGYMERGKFEWHSNQKDIDIDVWMITHWMPMPQPPKGE